MADEEVEVEVEEVEAPAPKQKAADPDAPPASDLKVFELTLKLPKHIAKIYKDKMAAVAKPQKTEES